MSNYLAVATATASLCEQLTEAILQDGSVPGAVVTHVAPTSEFDKRAPAINVFLYDVHRNISQPQADLPTRDADGGFFRSPTASLDLHYLLSFYGDETSLEPQRLLGTAVRTLHTQPVMTRELIRRTTEVTPWLDGSNLDRQTALITTIPTILSLPDLSNLWSMLLKVEYVLSCIYRVSVVLIDTPEHPGLALPVRAPRMSADGAYKPPVLSSAQPAYPIAGERLTLRGRNLRTDDTRVLIDGHAVTPLRMTDTSVEIELSPAQLPWLRAGARAVSVQVSGAARSNALTLLIGPASDFTAIGRKVTAKVSPVVDSTQVAKLLLNSKDGTTQASFDANPFRGSTADELHFDVTGIPAGVYLARLDVSGAQSRLETTNGEYSGPTVVLP